MKSHVTNPHSYNKGLQGELISLQMSYYEKLSALHDSEPILHNNDVVEFHPSSSNNSWDTIIHTLKESKILEPIIFEDCRIGDRLAELQELFQDLRVLILAERDDKINAYNQTLKELRKISRLIHDVKKKLSYNPRGSNTIINYKYFLKYMIRSSLDESDSIGTNSYINQYSFVTNTIFNGRNKKTILYR